MSQDSFTETTSTGWFSRIGNSITGLLFGGILLLVSTGLLWWNEGRSVATAKGLAEGAKFTVEADAATIDPAKEGQLVHLSGQTSLEGPAADPLFDVTAPDLVKLRRDVEVFQWVEEKHTTTRKKLGGGEETTIEYTYKKKWSSGDTDSSNFRQPDGHQNVESKIKSGEFTAQQVKLGAYELPSFLLSQWNDYQALPFPDRAALEQSMDTTATVLDSWLVLSKTPENPALGDARVKFLGMKNGPISVLARQVKETFEEYRTKQDTTIGRLETGVKSKDAMYAAAETENKIMAWMLRLAGFLAMFFGFMTLFRPLKVLADVLPIAGSIVGAGTGFVAFLISLAGSITIIALAWVWYRPMLGVSLLVAAGGAAWFLRKTIKTKATTPVIPPPIPA
jgi:hypothetical protein